MSDFKVLFNTISLAKNLNLIKLANEITVCLIKFLSFKSPASVVFIAKILEFLTDNKLRKQTVNRIKTWMASNKSYDMTLLELNSGIATTYFELKMIDEALIYYKKCLKYEQKYLGENHVFTATSYNQLGLLMIKKEKAKSALNYFKKSLNIKIRILPNSNPEKTNTLHNIALAYQHQSNFKKCIQHYEMVLERRLKYEGKSSLGTGITLSNLGIAYVQSGTNLIKGEKLMQEAIKINNLILGDPNAKNTVIHRYLAFSEWQKENCDFIKVEKLLTEALINNVNLLGNNELSTAFCYHDLFYFYWRTNQLTKAKKTGKKALNIYFLNKCQIVVVGRIHCRLRNHITISLRLPMKFLVAILGSYGKFQQIKRLLEI
jgi:tetratricopeptide (TPR) repeat protein